MELNTKELLILKSMEDHPSSTGIYFGSAIFEETYILTPSSMANRVASVNMAEFKRKMLAFETDEEVGELEAAYKLYLHRIACYIKEFGLKD